MLSACELESSSLYLKHVKSYCVDLYTVTRPLGSRQTPTRPAASCFEGVRNRFATMMQNQLSTRPDFQTTSCLATN